MDCRRNTYVGCGHPGEPRRQFLICRHCGCVEEGMEKPISKALSTGAKRAASMR